MAMGGLPRPADGWSGTGRSRWLRSRTPFEPTILQTMPDQELSQMTIRLPMESSEKLRLAAFAARQRPAELARSLVVRGLDDPRLMPRPAPPALAELNADAQRLVVVLTKTTGNLTQLDIHARELGELGSPLAGLAVDGGPLASMNMMARALGLALKAGGPCPPTSAVERIGRAAEQVNDLARALNVHRAAVPPADWHGPLTAMRAALAKASAP